MSRLVKTRKSGGDEAFPVGEAEAALKQRALKKGRGKQTAAELEEVWSETHGFKAEYVTEGVFFLGMMTTPDTLALGKVAEGRFRLRSCSRPRPRPCPSPPRRS